ncbi:MAG: tetratricopeptide repeat protein [Cyanobacteriota bacterium]
MKKTIIITIFGLILFSSNITWVNAQDMPYSFKIGVTEYRQGNYQKAANIMDKIIQINPADYHAKYYLAISLVKLKKVDQAKELYVEIIKNADNQELIEYAREGLKFLDPKTYKKHRNTNISIIENNKPQVNNQTVNTGVNSNQFNSVQLTQEQQLKINQVAAENKISPDELNNLINLLANNPSALRTINKLADSNNSENGPSKDFDPESVAKLVKALTLNSQIDLLNYDDDKKDKNNSSMDMLSMFTGGNSNGMQGNNIYQLMEYMKNPANQGKINPDTINTMLKQNMFGNLDMGGF